jgi:hypothetical protein
MSLRSSAPHAVAAVFIAIAAVGCSSAGSQPQVAALPTSAASGNSPSASASAGTPTGGRPRERLDETPSQADALVAPWNQCMTAHGGSQKGKLATPAVQNAALAACTHLMPLPPWQEDPANPKALGFVQRVVACLHQHGVRYAQVQNPPGQGEIEIALGGPQNDQSSINDGLQLIPTCNQQALRETASSTSP